MFRPTVLVLLLATTALAGFASSTTLLCVSGLPPPVRCVGTGECAGDLILPASGVPEIVGDDSLGLLACARDGEPTCDGMGRWTVRASFTKGEGTLSIAAYCGDTSVAACSTQAAGVPCEDVGGSGTGSFTCGMTVYGNIAYEDATGECIDPVDPTRVVRAVVVKADAHVDL